MPKLGDFIPFPKVGYIITRIHQNNAASNVLFKNPIGMLFFGSLNWLRFPPRFPFGMKDFMAYLSNIKSIQIRFKPRNQKFCDFLEGMGNRHA